MTPHKHQVLHIALAEKFMQPFIDFVETHLESPDRHRFIILDTPRRFPIRESGRVTLLAEKGGTILQNLVLSKAMAQAEKIVLHGLFSMPMIKLLALHPWLASKCYWIMWGGDLYYDPGSQRQSLTSRRNELMRRFVIRRMGHLVTYIPGEVAYARERYAAQGQFHECFCYPSNIFKLTEAPEKQGRTINILVGNSADPGNHHFEILDNLEKFKDHDIRIYAPLSYGSPAHAKQVEKVGKQRFGDAFVPLLELLPPEAYRELLGQIDIAVFNHRRQQAVGNIVTLLGLGKKVYMRSDVTSWQMFTGLGATLHNTEGLDIAPFDPQAAEDNRRIMLEFFSEQRLIAQLNQTF